MGRRSKLTPELIEAIADRIRVGSFPHVAAAACGISKSTYFRWMQRAEEKGAPKIYRELSDRVREAAGVARSNAEVRVFRDNPFSWLRYGPGREKPGEPGWTETPQTVRVEAEMQSRMEISVEEQALQEQILDQKARALAGGLAILCEYGIIEPGPMLKRLAAEDDLEGESGEIIDVQAASPYGGKEGNGESHGV